MIGRFLLGVPGPKIEAILNAAPGNELPRKFDNPESSAALAANAFGFFLDRPRDLPPLPGCDGETWPARSLALEAEVRFPWSGGRHPVLDCLVTTPSALIGVESKRFEPYRTKPLSDAYWRPVWGECMKGYEGVRDGIYGYLDAAQLFEHAFALRTEVHRRNGHGGLTPILFYVHAPPEFWPATGKPVDEGAKARHREEIEHFAAAVAGDEVTFVSCSWRELLDTWSHSEDDRVRAHADAVAARFSP